MAAVPRLKKWLGVAKQNVGLEAQWAAAYSFEEVRLNTLWSDYGSKEETAAGRFLAWVAADELSGGEAVEALWAGANPWCLHVRLPGSPVEMLSKGQPCLGILFVFFQGRLFGPSGPPADLQWLRAEARVEQGVDASLVELLFEGPDAQGVVCADKTLQSNKHPRL